MRYRVDALDIINFVLICGGLILICLLFTRCEYPEQRPTRVWEVHEMAINGVVMPSPIPLEVKDLE